MVKFELKLRRRDIPEQDLIEDFKDIGLLRLEAKEYKVGDEKKVFAVITLP